MKQKPAEWSNGYLAGSQTAWMGGWRDKTNACINGQMMGTENY